MKSKPSGLYVVLGLAAVALWFASHSPRKPGAENKPTPGVTLASPTISPGVPVPARQTSPSAAVPAAPVPPASVPPATAGDPSDVAGLPAGQAVGTPGAALPSEERKLTPDQAAQSDVGRVRHMVSDYHTLMGENPVGTNAEIMKQMMGGNPRQATLGPPEGISLNAQGELMDQWSTPYFFHQLGRDKMEVRSAGPDKVMWTADDVITR